MAPTLKSTEGKRNIHAEIENFSIRNSKSGMPSGLLYWLRVRSMRFCKVVVRDKFANWASSTQREISPRRKRRKIVATIKIEIAAAM